MPRSPSSSKPDWRQSAKPEASVGARWIKRILLTVFLFGLGGFLVWLLWPHPRPSTNFVILPMTEYRLWIQPAPAFPANVDRFKEAVEGGEFSLIKGFPQLEGVFPEQTSRDVLVLYITAHGISHDGKACLLKDDFDVAEAESGRLELGRLFEQLRECPAKTKLLVLEAGHTVTDPRLGMPVNEFPRLLESELKEFDDPDLWVLTASQSLEISHVSYSLGQSVFGHFLVEGFKGSADPDGNNRDIELKELFAFVRDGVSDWVKRHCPGQTQTPMLIHAGEGRVDDPSQIEDLFVFHVARQDEPQADESEAATDEETATDKEQKPVEEAETEAEDEPSENPEPKPQAPARAAAVKDDSPDTADAESPASPPGTEKGPVAKSSDNPPEGSGPSEDPPDEMAPVQPATETEPVAESSDDPTDAFPEVFSDDGDALDRAHRLVEAGWRWRDELQSRQTDDGWSPVDYAPHLWHEYQELMLVHEWRWRYKMPLNEGQLATLKRLARGWPAASAGGEGTVLDRLADARREFLRGQAKADFDRWSPQLPGVERAVRLRNDLLFEIPYYLRWHAGAAGASPDDRVLYQTIHRLVDELGRLGSLLESMEPPQTTPPSRKAKLARLDKLCRTLEDLRGKLTNRELSAQARSLLEDTGGEVPYTKMECLLSTPLLEADLRTALLDALEKSPNPSEDTREIASYTMDLEEWYNNRRSRWAALANQAELETAVIQKLADSDFRPTGDLADLSDGGSYEAEEKLWTAYRQLGLDLAGFYGGLPQRITRALPSDDSQTIRLAARSLALVDPREVHARRYKGASRLTLRPFDWQSMIGPRPSVEGPETVALRPDGWSEFSLQIDVTGRRVAKVSVLPDFDPTQLNIQSYDGTTYRPLSSQDVDLGPEGGERLRLRARPVGDVKKFAALAIKITAEDAEASHKVRFLIPPPDRVDLVVQRLLDATGRRVPCPGGDVGVVRCPIFPNRPAEYRLGLKNLSGKPRTVAVRFWSVPQRSPEEKAARSGPLNDIGRPLPGFVPLDDSVEIKLPAEDQFVPLAFPAPDAEKKKDKDDDSDAPADKPDAPEGENPTPGAPITHGIVCQIADPEGGDPWIRWIDFDWITPYEYIEPSVAYSFAQRKVTIELRLRDDPDLMPGMLSEQPVAIFWENALALPESTSPNFKASIKRAGGVARLWAENIDPDVTRQIQIRLSVDGYPRALVFDRFDCDSDHRRIDVDDNLTGVEITQPEEAKPYRLTDAGLEPAMSVKFNVDAPYDALDRADDFVKAGIDKNGNLQFDEDEQDDILTFWTDRQRTAVLEELTPEGTLKLHTQVDDFTVDLSPSGPANKEVLVLAQLFIAASKSAQDRVSVILDRGEPEISLQSFPKTIPPGSPLTVRAKVTDVSGVELVEFGFDVDRSGGLEEGEKPLKVFSAAADGIWEATLQTKDLVPGVTYSLIVQATDGVGSSAKRKTLITVGRAPEKAMPAKAKTVTVQGRASLGGATRWSTLRLSGIPGTATIDKDTGDFTFDDVPPGKYTVSAKGSAGNRSKKGSATVTITGDEPTVRVDIPME